MSATDREEAQSRRADARRRRRGEDESNGATPVEQEPGTDQPEDHSALKTAAKVAAAGAALGAAVGAALANRDEPGEQPTEESGDEQEAHAEPELDEGRDEPHADGPDDDQPEAEDDDGEEQTVEAEPAAERAESPQATRQESEAREQPRDQPRQPRHGAPPNETAEVVRVAREQLGALLGKEPESVSALARIDDGWVVTLEVVELPRVPDSTDVLASYELELDEDRNVIRYARRRRYSRSQADADGGL